MAEILLDVGVMFAAVAVAGAVASRLNQSVIPFYIVTGMALGPFVLGRSDDWLGVDFPHVATNEFIEVGAELGIVFLLFFLGLEFSLDRLIENKEKIGKAGTVDLLNLVVGFVIGAFFFCSSGTPARTRPSRSSVRYSSAESSTYRRALSSPSRSSTSAG